jgi:tRNA modification GTPase
LVIAGPPNVGKSSLLNALAGFERSIVSPEPGTTRDIVTVETALNGWPVEFADTAGLRDTAAGLEREGGQLASARIREADLCVWVVDATDPQPVWPSETMADESWLYAVNKCDLPPAWNLDAARTAVHVSALSGAGLVGLCSRIVDRLVPLDPPAGTAIPFHPECSAYLHRICSLVAAGQITEAIEELRGCES